MVMGTNTEKTIAKSVVLANTCLLVGPEPDKPNRSRQLISFEGLQYYREEWRTGPVDR